MDFKLNKGCNSCDLNLRDVIKEMLDDWGYYIILVRVSSMICSCASKEGQQTSSFCPNCFGIGRKIKLEKKRMIGVPGSQVISRPNTTKNGLIGEIYSDAKRFYCDYSIHPNVGSFIYEVSWAKDRVVNLHAVYKIEFAEPLRMEHGQIEYYAIATHREVVNIDYKEKALKQIFRGR